LPRCRGHHQHPRRRQAPALAAHQHDAQISF
jgi:hypothetical protein